MNSEYNHPRMLRLCMIKFCSIPLQGTLKKVLTTRYAGEHGENTEASSGRLTFASPERTPVCKRSTDWFPEGRTIGDTRKEMPQVWGEFRGLRHSFPGRLASVSSSVAGG